MSERVRFLTDENVRLPIIHGLQRLQPAIDCMLAKDADLRDMPDPLIRERVATEGRILLSHDVTTMPAHFAALINNGRHSAGVILLHQTLPYDSAIDALHLIWEASSPEEWIDILDFWS